MPRMIGEMGKGFVLLTNQVLNMELTEEGFMALNQIDRQELYDRVAEL